MGPLATSWIALGPKYTLAGGPTNQIFGGAMNSGSYTWHQYQDHVYCAYCECRHFRAARQTVQCTLQILSPVRKHSISSAVTRRAHLTGPYQSGPARGVTWQLPNQSGPAWGVTWLLINQSWDSTRCHVTNPGPGGDVIWPSRDPLPAFYWGMAACQSGPLCLTDYESSELIIILWIWSLYHVVLYKFIISTSPGSPTT